MKLEVVPLEHEHLKSLMLRSTYPSPLSDDMTRAYFSPGSVAYCLLENGDPVLAGGIVNLGWNRGEAWLIPTTFLHENLKFCLALIRDMLPKIADDYGFVRVQATCINDPSGKFARGRGFEYEGTLKKFGPNGETCDIYARIFG
jgi:hypothetical protein